MSPPRMASGSPRRALSPLPTVAPLPGPRSNGPTLSLTSMSSTATLSPVATPRQSLQRKVMTSGAKIPTTTVVTSIRTASPSRVSFSGGGARQRSPSPGAGAIAAQAAVLGRYVVVKAIAVTEGLALDSMDVGVLHIGTEFVVLEVVALEDAQRVRGRIADPPGWASLHDTSTGMVFAVPAKAVASAPPTTAFAATSQAAPAPLLGSMVMRTSLAWTPVMMQPLQQRPGAMPS